MLVGTLLLIAGNLRGPFAETGGSIWDDLHSLGLAPASYAHKCMRHTNASLYIGNTYIYETCTFYHVRTSPLN